MNYIEVVNDFEWLNSRYRITYYEFANLVEIKQLVKLTWLQRIFRTDGQDKIWRTIYHGNIGPLQKTVEIYNIGNKTAALNKLSK